MGYIDRPVDWLGNKVQIVRLKKDNSAESWRSKVFRSTGRLNYLEIRMGEIYALELKSMVLLTALPRDPWFGVVGLGRIYMSKICRNLALLFSHDR